MCMLTAVEKAEEIWRTQALLLRAQARVLELQAQVFELYAQPCRACAPAPRPRRRRRRRADAAMDAAVRFCIASPRSCEDGSSGSYTGPMTCVAGSMPACSVSEEFDACAAEKFSKDGDIAEVSLISTVSGEGLIDLEAEVSLVSLTSTVAESCGLDDGSLEACQLAHKQAFQGVLVCIENSWLADGRERELSIHAWRTLNEKADDMAVTPSSAVFVQDAFDGIDGIDVVHAMPSTPGEIERRADMFVSTCFDLASAGDFSSLNNLLRGSMIEDGDYSSDEEFCDTSE